MPTYRRDLSAIAPYEPGLPIEEVARRHGLDPRRIIKLASNESPYGPFPAAIDAMVRSAATTNRYPDNEGYDLREGLGKSLGIEPASIWLGEARPSCSAPWRWRWAAPAPTPSMPGRPS